MLHQACNGYERLIFPAMCPPDVCYHLNVALLGSGYLHAAINAAVEESTLCMRDKQLLEQDQVSCSLFLSLSYQKLLSVTAFVLQIVKDGLRYFN